MNIEKIKKLIEKYLEGETTLQEEKQLRKYFRRGKISNDVESYANLFEYFEEMSNEDTSSEFDPFAKLDKQAGVNPKLIGNHWKKKTSSGTNKKTLIRSLQVAAGIILLLIGFSAGQYLNDSTVSGQEVAVLQEEIQKMKEALMYDGIYQNASAGERLSAVNLSTQISVTEKELDQQIINILVYTMNNDKSVNVRMAAAEALFRFRSDSRIQQALIHSLIRQKEPLMQITLIDMLVELNAQGAVNEMKKLLMDMDTREIVKERLEAGIAELNT